MWRKPLALLIGLQCLSLTGCSTLTNILGIEEPPPRSDVVRLLCARADDGTFMFGVVKLSRQDTPETIRQVTARNAAWDAATENGKLCAALGAAPFGGMAWGSKP